MAKQNRFYILIAALTFSNSAMGLNLSGYCGTDSSRTCYTCNPYTPGTIEYDHQEDVIDASCSDHDDGEVWCKGYTSNSAGDIIYDTDTTGYECTEAGWTYRNLLCNPETCNQTGEWRTYNATAEVRNNSYCTATTGGSICVTTTQYRCIENYYGGGASPVCTPCPSSPDNVAYCPAENEYIPEDYKEKGLTKGPGATTIKECYIRTIAGSGGFGYIDGTGVYEFVNDCFYS